MKEINDKTFRDFLDNHLDLVDFGYLVIAINERCIEEAVSNIREKFNKFMYEPEA